MELVIKLGYNDFFDGLKPTIEELIRGFELVPLLDFITSLNRADDKFKSDTDEIVFITSKWMASSSAEEKKYIIDRYLSKISRASSFRSTIVINPISTLRLLEYVLHFNNLSDGSIRKDILEMNLFKAYLHFNDIENQRQDALHLKLHKNQEISTESFFTYRMVSSSFEQQMYHYRYKKELWGQILKFFQYLQYANTAENKLVKCTLDNFLLSNGIKDWKHYFLSLFELFKATQKTGIAIFDDSQEVQYYKKILSRYCLNEIDEEYNQDNFVGLRKFPVYEIQHNHFLVLHFPFLMDKLFKNIFFEVGKFVSEQDYNSSFNFRNDYQQSFGEEFLLPNALKLLFKNKYIQISGKNVATLNKNLAFPDYYVRNGNKVYLFENKYIIFSDRAKMSYDPEIFKSEIREKLFLTKEGKKKGAMQLLNCIYKLLNSDYNGFDNFKSKNLRIYPIIILEDSSFCTFGINVVLNEWFRDEINKLGGTKFLIKNITIINIDDLLFYNSKLADLSEIVDDYHRFNQSKNEDAGLSFSQYLEVFKFKNEMTINKKEIEHILTEPFKFYNQ